MRMALLVALALVLGPHRATPLRAALKADLAPEPGKSNATFHCSLFETAALLLLGLR